VVIIYARAVLFLQIFIITWKDGFAEGSKNFS